VIKMDTQTTEQKASPIELPDVILEHIEDTNELLSRMDQVYNSTAQARGMIQQKFASGIEKLDINPMGDAEQLEAQLKLLSGFDSLLSSREKAFTTRVVTRMKQRDSESSNKLLGELVAKVLTDFKVDAKTAFVPSAHDDLSMDAINDIDAKLAGMGSVTYDTGELKMDNQDIT